MAIKFDGPAEYETTPAYKREVNGTIDRYRKTRDENDAARAKSRPKIPELGVATPRPSRYQRKVEAAAAATAAGHVDASPRLKRAKVPKEPKVLVGGKPVAETKAATMTLGDDAKTGIKAKRQRKAKNARATRKKLIAKIPRKYQLTRGIVRASLATGYYAWRGGGKAIKGTKLATKAVAGKVKSKASERSEHAPRKRFKSSFMCCGESFADAESANRHFLEKHMDEEGVAVKPDTSATVVTATTRRNAGKRRVVLPPEHIRRKGRRTIQAVPTGRHRKTSKTKPEALVSAYKNKITEIGVKAMSENGQSRTVAQGFKAWGEDKPRQMTLSDFRDKMAGLERALLTGAEALEEFERHMNRDTESGGLNIDRSVTRPGMMRAKNGLSESAAGLLITLAMFEEAYAPYLRTQLKAPNLKIS